ncbi:hypothetical protein [Pontibacter fetidus]|uniref:Uncharacterized protein n=1 Tax=Pontibacter fetidus TaxID=2700082 RepID=A0A6B2H687_9BACT|nr:hypothetical protein [Pontibacter fetidus]NDK55360.1 hypothetical protein [Pontibacter fetidus]
MARRNEYERDRSYGGYYGTSSDGGYTHDYDNQHRSGGNDRGREIGAGRSMRGNDYYHNAAQDYRNYNDVDSQNVGARPYDDRSRGMRYGESTGYGHSDYSSRNNPYQNREQYNTGPYEEYIDYSSRNYGSFDNSPEPDDYTPEPYNTGGRGYYRDTYSSGNDYSRNYDRNQGYDRSFRGMPQGYGSTRYDERDLDRERSVRGNRNNLNRNDYTM